MTQTQTLLMQMGQLTLIIALCAFFAIATIGTVWLWKIAIWRVIHQRGSYTALREFLAWSSMKPRPATPAIEHALCVIGKALCASHGCVATDLPEAQVTDTSWRIDHNPEMAQLAVLKAALGSVSSDTGP